MATFRTFMELHERLSANYKLSEYDTKAQQAIFNVIKNAVDETDMLIQQASSEPSFALPSQPRSSRIADPSSLINRRRGRGSSARLRPAAEHNATRTQARVRKRTPTAQSESKVSLTDPESRLNKKARTKQSDLDIQAKNFVHNIVQRRHRSCNATGDYYSVEQGSDTWKDIKLGMITGSIARAVRCNGKGVVQIIPIIIYIHIIFIKLGNRSPKYSIKITYLILMYLYIYIYIYIIVIIINNCY